MYWLGGGATAIGGGEKHIVYEVISIIIVDQQQF